jgi:hypothetical protein
MIHYEDVEQPATDTPIMHLQSSLVKQRTQPLVEQTRNHLRQLWPHVLDALQPLAPAPVSMILRSIIWPHARKEQA